MKRKVVAERIIDTRKRFQRGILGGTPPKAFELSVCMSCFVKSYLIKLYVVNDHPFIQLICQNCASYYLFLDKCWPTTKIVLKRIGIPKGVIEMIKLYCI